MKTLATIMVLSFIISAICSEADDGSHHEFINAVALVTGLVAVTSFCGFIILFCINIFRKPKK